MKNLLTFFEFISESSDLSYRTFVRFGKLGIVKQDGYGSTTFHAPPASRGFYAMPLKFQEYFLIGSLNTTQPNQLSMPKKSKFYDDVTGEFDYDKYSKKIMTRYSEVRHSFVVDKDVEFWHHLYVPNNEVISRHNEWVKTTYSAWKKAVAKESVRLRAESGGKLGINSTKKGSGSFSKDHFEVFFDTNVV